MINEIAVIMDSIITQLNGSKYMTGVMMLLMNIGSKYISLELSELQENILNHKLIRRCLVFVIVFFATKDIKVSLVLTAVFIILVTGIFNEESKYCILPHKKDDKRNISKVEYTIAKEIVDKYEKQKIIESFINS